MPRIPVHTLESAPDASRDTLKALEARVGKVLNTYGAAGLEDGQMVQIRRGAVSDPRLRVADA